MDFDQRLQKAIDRGSNVRQAQQAEAQRSALSQEELKQLHSKYRLEVSDHIERCLKQLAGHFPGFQSESIVSDKGWGAAIRRDDLSLAGGARKNLYSRLEILVKPLSSVAVLDLTAKGTVHNKEVLRYDHFQRLAEADTTSFTELIDLWTLEFAERYAAAQ